MIKPRMISGALLRRKKVAFFFGQTWTDGLSSYIIRGTRGQADVKKRRSSALNQKPGNADKYGTSGLFFCLEKMK